jgi:hypothetical protein
MRFHVISLPHTQTTGGNVGSGIVIVRYLKTAAVG